MVTKVTKNAVNTPKQAETGKVSSREKPWLKHLGKLNNFHKEIKRIDRRIEEAFEQIDTELWQ